jgi:hypothetical protein
MKQRNFKLLLPCNFQFLQLTAISPTSSTGLAVEEGELTTPVVLLWMLLIYPDTILLI